MNNIHYETAMLVAWTEILTDNSISEALRSHRVAALRTVEARLHQYEKRAIDLRLLNTIAAKKIEQILGATTKQDLHDIAQPPKPHYNGAEIIPSRFSVPEEELILWSETSLTAPIKDCASKRFWKLFADIYPDEAKKIFEVA